MVEMIKKRINNYRVLQFVILIFKNDMNGKVNEDV